MLPMLVACAAGLAATFCIERWRRPAPAAVAVHAGIYLLAFVLLALLFQRAGLGAALALALHLLLRALDNAKRSALREPLIFADLGLYAQALRHPRLYLPYLQPLPTLLAVLALAAALVAGFTLEPRTFAWLPAALLTGFAAGLLWAGCRAARRALRLEPHADVAAFGMLGAGLLYWLAEREPLAPAPAPVFALREVLQRRPDLVAIECESFFDARRLPGGVPGDLLPRFDALCAQGESGCLTVPAWGAYTMRTEFAFLSGIAPAQLGVHRFNPYRRFARRPLPTLASVLRNAGYRTVCVHPYPATFFGRDRVFAQLGFDEFVDLAAFADAARDGPYVADAAVARTIAAILARADQPLFVFAITMENHGPQRLEAGPEGDELAIYLRHLRNADRMIGMAAETLQARAGGGVLCAYGDHVPSLPAVYAAAGYEDARTDYLIWTPQRARRSRADLPVEALAARMLRTAGLSD